MEKAPEGEAVKKDCLSIQEEHKLLRCVRKDGSGKKGALVTGAERTCGQKLILTALIDQRRSATKRWKIDKKGGIEKNRVRGKKKESSTQKKKEVSEKKRVWSQ